MSWLECDLRMSLLTFFHLLAHTSPHTSMTVQSIPDYCHLKMSIWISGLIGEEDDCCSYWDGEGLP